MLVDVLVVLLEVFVVGFPWLDVVLQPVFSVVVLLLIYVLIGLS